MIFSAAMRRVAGLIPDQMYLQLRYFARFRRRCDFRDPQTYNEKLQWMKINYRVPGEWRLVDKYEVKSLAAAQIGDEHIIPTLALYDSVSEVEFDSLPNAFVLKCTHDSGGVAIVRDKNSIDVGPVLARLKASMRKNYFTSGREPHYRHIQPRIIAEPLLSDEAAGQLLDYKFFCFDGEVKALFVASDRAEGNVKFDYFDAHFRLLDLRQPYPNSAVPPEKPEQFDLMLKIAQVLSQGHPHVRVDLYQVNGRVYFGELTFYHFSGMQPFVPAHWDRTFGNWLSLPTRVRN